MITLKAGIISLDGKRVVKVKRTALPDDVKELGESVAREVLKNGGAEILGRHPARGKTGDHYIRN